MRKAAIGAVLTVWLTLCTASVALAADSTTGGTKIGANIGNLLESWAKALYGGGAALIALMFLLNRKFADLALFLLAAVIVGGFVLDPSGVEGVVTGIWNQLAA